MCFAPGCPETYGWCSAWKLGFRTETKTSFWSQSSNIGSPERIPLRLFWNSNLSGQNCIVNLPVGWREYTRSSIDLLRFSLVCAFVVSRYTLKLLHICKFLTVFPDDCVPSTLHRETPPKMSASILLLVRSLGRVSRAFHSTPARCMPLKLN